MDVYAGLGAGCLHTTQVDFSSWLVSNKHTSNYLLYPYSNIQNCSKWHSKVILFFRENKACHFMWTICLDVRPYSLKNNKNENILEWRLLLLWLALKLRDKRQSVPQLVLLASFYCTLASCSTHSHQFLHNVHAVSKCYIKPFRFL